MKQNKPYRFITFLLIGLLSIAFSQSFAKVEKVEKAKTEQSSDQDNEQDTQEHILKTYEAVISVDHHVADNDADFVPSPFFPEEAEGSLLSVEQLTISTLSYFEVLFETSICTNAP